MSSKISVFLDSDVVISSLLSEKGASHELLQVKSLKLNVSNHSIEETLRVSKRLGIEENKTRKLTNKFKTVILEDIDNIKEKYQDFCSDINDDHIVAGAAESNAKFLVTYNLKDYKIDRIKAVLNISIMTPGKFLQYLRSIQ